MENNDRIAELEAEIAQLKHIVTSLADENAKLKILNDWYLEQFRLAQHRRFGSSSEKTEVPDQLGLFNEAEILADEAPETVGPYTRKKHKGKPLRWRSTRMAHGKPLTTNMPIWV